MHSRAWNTAAAVEERGSSTKASPCFGSKTLPGFGMFLDVFGVEVEGLRRLIGLSVGLRIPCLYFS